MKHADLEAKLHDATKEACEDLLAHHVRFVNSCPIFSREQLYAPADKRRYDEYLALIDGMGLKTYQHHAAVTLYPLTEQIMHASVRAARKEIEIAALFGCRVYVIHPPVIEFCSALDKASYLDAAARMLRPLCDAAAERGMRVAIETTTDTEMMLAIVSATAKKNLGICLDTGMCYVQENGTVCDAVRRIGHLLVATHINDEEGVYYRHQHLFPGEGGIDWIRLRDAFLESGYRGPHFFELEAALDRISDFWNSLFAGKFVPRSRSGAERHYFDRNLADARIEYEKLYGGETRPEVKAELGLRRAVIEFKSGDCERSLDICDRIAKQCSPAEGSFAFEMAKAHRGKCLEQMGDYVGAAAVYAQYTGNDPIVQMFAGALRAGQCYYVVGDYGNAIRSLGRIPQDSPCCQHGLLISAACHQKQGRHARARRVLAQLETAASENPRRFCDVLPVLKFL